MITFRSQTVKGQEIIMHVGYIIVRLNERMAECRVIVSAIGDMQRPV